MRKCPGCGRNVSDFIAICPNCGCNIKNKTATPTHSEYEDISIEVNAKHHIITLAREENTKAIQIILKRRTITISKIGKIFLPITSIAFVISAFLFVSAQDILGPNRGNLGVGGYILYNHFRYYLSRTYDYSPIIQIRTISIIATVVFLIAVIILVVTQIRIRITSFKQKS